MKHLLVLGQWLVSKVKSLYICQRQVDVPTSLFGICGRPTIPITQDLINVQRNVQLYHCHITGNRKNNWIVCWLTQLWFYSTPICESNEEYLCAWQQINPSFEEFISHPFPKTCEIIQYSGEIEWEWNGNPDFSHEAYFAYNFAPPKTIIVQEEYLIYDTIGFIGSVGGTLGMFIGFSFSNAIAIIIRNIELLKSKFCK